RQPAFIPRAHRMREPSPAISELARQILWREAAGSREPEAVTAALDLACKKIGVELENLVGLNGSSALIGRARKLASAAVSSGAIESESVAALAHLLGLLASLLGEVLAPLPVRKTWPDPVLGAALPGSPQTDA